MEYDVIYYIFMLLAMVSSLFVILSNNSVSSVFFLILVFVLVACITLMLNIEFIGMIFIIIYVGAIAVLFLFVVMMLNIRVIEKVYTLIMYLPVGLILGIALFYDLYNSIKIDYKDFKVSNSLFEWVNVVDTKSSIFNFGEVLYNYFLYEFLLGGIILLVAMIGTIILTLNHKINVKRQEVYKQVGRSINIDLYR